MTPEDSASTASRIDWVAITWRIRALSRAAPRQARPAHRRSARPRHDAASLCPPSSPIFERLNRAATTLWNIPASWPYFANSATPEGILGELLAAALNPNGMVWKTSPASTNSNR